MMFNIRDFSGFRSLYYSINKSRMSSFLTVKYIINIDNIYYISGFCLEKYHQTSFFRSIKKF